MGLQAHLAEKIARLPVYYLLVIHFFSLIIIHHHMFSGMYCLYFKVIHQHNSWYVYDQVPPPQSHSCQVLCCCM